MGVVSEKSLSALENGGFLEFNCGIGRGLNQSGLVEVYKVFIFKTRNGFFKLQWEMGKRPSLPVLKEEIREKIVAETKNKNSFLTSGYDNARGGGMDQNSLLRFINFLNSLGIKLETI
jgi:hypothetical protein